MTLAVALSLPLAGCAVDSPTGSLGGGRVDVAAIGLQAALIPSPADAGAGPIERIRTVTTRAADGEVLDDTVTEVSPSAESWEIVLTIPTGGAVTVVVTVYLMSGEGDTETVEFSGRTEPILLWSGAQATPEVTLVRGPLANLFTTSVTITAAPQALELGGSAQVAATATSSQAPPPTVFWTSLDPGLVTLAGTLATAVAPGGARLVASAGAYADTAVIVVTTTDVDPPFVVATSPAPDETGVPTSIRITATFNEALDGESVTAATFTLTDGLGSAVAGATSYDTLVATFVPYEPLDPLRTYTAGLGAAIRDLSGNELGDLIAWRFTTGAAPGGGGAFDPGLGLLVAIAFDASTGRLALYDDFADSIRVYDTLGVATGLALPRPGLSSNDIDLDYLDAPATIGSAQVPANALLVHNGEGSPGTLYAIDAVDGAVLDSIRMPTAGNPVGGAYHVGRGTFFSLEWTTDVITELEPATGAALASFPVAPQGSPSFDVFYGDLEVDPASGNLIVVSSTQPTVRVLSPTGVFVADYDVGPLGIAGMSGIAWDAATRTAWICSTSGLVYRVTGIR